MGDMRNTAQSDAAELEALETREWLESLDAAKALLAVVDVFAAVPGGHVYVEIPSMRPAPPCEMTVLDAGEGDTDNPVGRQIGQLEQAFGALRKQAG